MTFEKYTWSFPLSLSPNGSQSVAYMNGSQGVIELVILAENVDQARSLAIDYLCYPVVISSDEERHWVNLVEHTTPTVEPLAPEFIALNIRQMVFRATTDK